MKILHTADWHLGKKLYLKSRLKEQEEALEEIAEIADKEKVDAVIAAGDIFDTAVPPAEAEELFYKSAVKLAGNGRDFIAIAGNHDDALRLSAPSHMGRFLRVRLIGESESVVIEKNAERLNIAALPYPMHSKLATPENKDIPYAAIVKQKLAGLSSFFSTDCFNMTAAHIFMTKGGLEKEAEIEKSDERELGTAALLPLSILCDSDYTALGHIHKPFCVSSSKSVYYSGSLLNYDFSDTAEKSVIIVGFKKDAQGNKITEIKREPLKSGKKLIKAKAENFESALKELKTNAGAYVYLLYDGAPLSASEITELKKQPSYTFIENVFKTEKTKREFKKRGAKELFCDFFKQQTKKEPSKEILDIFLKAVNGEELF